MIEADVRFVIVGVGGINFYADSPGQAFATLDLGALLEPQVENPSAALAALAAEGCRFEAHGEPFLDIDDADALATIVRNGAALTARHDEAGQLDLMLSIAGFDYSELDADAVPFEVAHRRVHVGKLEKLLQSKENSGRPKDLEFLRAFQARSEEVVDD